ncbi:integrase catalytic domain-containing protein [Trichonephila clavipes]|nr:integrase catalytic domain-containing protein [Trichonephila clavipes]
MDADICVKDENAIFIIKCVLEKIDCKKRARERKKGLVRCKPQGNMIPSELVLEFNRPQKDEGFDLSTLLRFLNLDIRSRERASQINNHKPCHYSPPPQDRTKNKGSYFPVQRMKPPPNRVQFRPHSFPILLEKVELRSRKCLYCNKGHELDACRSFSANEKRENLRKKESGYLCLSPGHRAMECLSEFWDLENLGIEAEVSDEENIDKDIMSEFEAGISYQNKRYKAKFPWKPNMKILLENNEEIASVQAALTTCVESKQILEDAIDEHKESLNTLIASKVLGVGWNEKSDTFYFDSSDLGTFLSKRINTKRYLLQAAGRLFDPVGFIGPYTVRIKCLIQEIWCLGLDWDDKLPKQLEVSWNKWCNEIHYLSEINIP